MPAQLPQNPPTPEEAARALRDVEQRRDQVLREGSGPRWMWYLLGAAFVVRGLVADFAGGGASQVATWVIIGVLLVLVLLQHTRWGASLLGYRAMPARGQFPVWYLVVVSLAAGAAVIVISLVLGLAVAVFGLPYRETVVNSGTGLVVAFVGPLMCRIPPPRARWTGR